MDRTPQYDDIDDQDQEFANHAEDWSHVAHQVRSMTGESTSTDQVRSVLMLLGVTLRSASKRDLKALLARLGISIGSGDNNVDVLMDHEHDDFKRLPDEVPEELQTWRAKCNKCGVERRVVRG